MAVPMATAQRDVAKDEMSRRMGVDPAVCSGGSSQVPGASTGIGALPVRTELQGAGSPAFRPADRRLR
jgi:hypothetical protein